MTDQYNIKQSRAALREAFHLIVSREVTSERAIASSHYKENERKIKKCLDSLQDEQITTIMDQAYPTRNYLERKAINTVFHLTEGSQRLKVTDLSIGLARSASLFLADGLRHAKAVGRLDRKGLDSLF